MRRRFPIVIAVLLAAILLTVLTPGTPIAGDNSVAARTAGLNLGTAPTLRDLPTAAPLQLRAVGALLLLGVLQLLLRATDRRPRHDGPTVVVASALLPSSAGRRGPPRPLV